MLRSGSLLSRGLALVLMLGAILGFYQFALLPLLMAHWQAGTTIKQTEALLQRYHALAEQRTQLAKQMSAYERAVADANGYLTGPNDVLAAAALQERVRSVIERAHGELRSTQLLPARAVRTGVPVRLIALKFRFAIDINGIRDVLYELETGDPYLFVEELSIQRHDTPNSASALDVSLAIGGYTNGSGRGDTPPTSPSATPPGPHLNGQAASPALTRPHHQAGILHSAHAAGREGLDKARPARLAVPMRRTRLGPG